MQSSEFRMFSEEITRLEAEAQEAQQAILHQTERLRVIEQRIIALRSVVAGTEARTFAMMQPGLEKVLPTESEIRAQRGALNVSLFGVQRANSPHSVDAANYRSASAENRFTNPTGVTKREKDKTSEPATSTATKPTLDPTAPHIDTTS